MTSDARPRRVPIRSDVKAAAVAAYLDGASSTKVAAAYGVSTGSVLAWVRMSGGRIRRQGTRS